MLSLAQARYRCNEADKCNVFARWKKMFVQHFEAMLGGIFGIERLITTLVTVCMYVLTQV